MNDETSPVDGKPKPTSDATSAQQNETQSQTQQASQPPVAESVNGYEQQPNPTESEAETDRKQDESIRLLADQTEWIAKQTKWTRNQVIASTFLGAVTLGVLIYHGIVMRQQSQAMADQTAVMKGQLESMNSGSDQTRQMIAAMRDQATATKSQAGTNQALADQNKELIGATLAQAEASKKSAQIAQEAFYIGDRPYLSANAVLDKFEAGIAPMIGILFENHGKTPAIELVSGAMVSVGNVPKPDLTNITSPEVIAENLKQLPYGNFSPYGGKMFLAAGAKMLTQIRGPELTATLVEDIKQLRRFLFVFGGARYKDGLGRSHALEFCLFYNATEDMFVACPTFNRTK